MIGNFGTADIFSSQVIDATVVCGSDFASVCIIIPTCRQQGAKPNSVLALEAFHRVPAVGGGSSRNAAEPK
jgi:hypothetical protein